MRQRAKFVPEPTTSELVIAYILMYVKLPVAFYLFGSAVRTVCEKSHDILGFLLWGALALAAALLPLVACLWVPIGFTQRLRGRMTGLRFMVLRIVSLWMIVGGILSLVNQFFLDGVLNTPIRIIMMPIAPMTQGVHAIVISIWMIICSLFSMSGISDIRKERCPHCGGYGYKEDKSVPGSYQVRQTGGSSVTTREVEWRDVETYSTGARVTDLVKETTRTTATYAYQGKSHLKCRYCEWDFGVWDYDGTYTRETKTVGRDTETRYY